MAEDQFQPFPTKHAIIFPVEYYYTRLAVLLAVTVHSLNKGNRPFFCW